LPVQPPRAIVTRPAREATQWAADLQARGIAALALDWTRYDADITRYLEQHGRSGVPLYVLYPRGTGAGRVLPQLLTPDIVRQAVGNENPVSTSTNLKES